MEVAEGCMLHMQQVALQKLLLPGRQHGCAFPCCLLVIPACVVMTPGYIVLRTQYNLLYQLLQTLTLHTLYRASHYSHNNPFQSADMKHTILSAVFLFPFAYSKPSRQLCSGTAQEASDGN